MEKKTLCKMIFSVVSEYGTVLDIFLLQFINRTFYALIDNNYKNNIGVKYENKKQIAIYNLFKLAAYNKDDNIDVFNFIKKFNTNKIIKINKKFNNVYIYLNDPIIFRIASQNGNINNMKWLRSEGCVWDEHTFSMAVYNGNIENMDWLLKLSCPYNKEQCYKFTEKNNVIEWINNNM
jgi:hypothetical protein